MLEEALRYPTAGDRALDRLVVGGVLQLFAVLVLPAFVVYGYVLRCLAAVAAGEEGLPPWEDWAGLFVDGLKAFVVVAVYGLVPVVVAFSIFVPVSVVTGVGSGGGDRLAVVGVLAMLVMVAVSLLVVYVVGAALTTLAVSGRLASAFDVRAVLGFAASGPYLLAIVLAVVVQVFVGAVIVAAVVFTLGLALLVLVPLGAFVNFWLYLVVAHLLGHAHRETMAGRAS